MPIIQAPYRIANDACLNIPKTRGFKMAMLNVASLLKHLDEIRLLLHNKYLDVLAVNETRFDSTISDGIVSIEGYDVLRADRDRNGGGVCIYVRCHINYENRPDLVPTDLEAVCVEIKQANSQSFIVSSIYRPPCSTSEVFIKIESLIKSIDDKNREFIFWEI
jgi:exonuclease III